MGAAFHSQARNRLVIIDTNLAFVKNKVGLVGAGGDVEVAELLGFHRDAPLWRGKTNVQRGKLGAVQIEPQQSSIASGLISCRWRELLLKVELAPAQMPQIISSFSRPKQPIAPHKGGAGGFFVRPGVKEHHLCRFDEQRPHRRGRGEKLYRSFYM